ncbi:MAG TPA: cytochrome c [Saprospiraceae bacterium]|nr:cytochrome c [Saprospiraceae bacterium]
MNSKRTLAGMLICAAIMYLGACGGETSSGGASNIDGKAVFTRYCALCHGEDGKREANGAKDITVSQMPLKERIALIKSGKNLMTPFEGILTPEEMEAAARHSMTLK